MSTPAVNTDIYVNYTDTYSHPTIPALPALPDITVGRLTAYNVNGVVHSLDSITNRHTYAYPSVDSNGAFILHLSSQGAFAFVDRAAYAATLNMHRLGSRKGSVLLGADAFISENASEYDNAGTGDLGGLVAIGLRADASYGDANTAIGRDAKAKETKATAYGGRAGALKRGSVAVGHNAQATGIGAIAIGGFTGDASAIAQPGNTGDPRCVAVGDGSVQIGLGINSSPNTLKFRGFELCDASGNIPKERLVTAVVAILEELGVEIPESEPSA